MIILEVTHIYLLFLSVFELKKRYFDVDSIVCQFYKARLAELLQRNKPRDDASVKPLSIKDL